MNNINSIGSISIFLELLFSCRHMRTSGLVGTEIIFVLVSHDFLSVSLSVLPSYTLVSPLPLLQATRVLLVSRKWTRVPPAPVTITGHATPKALAPWGLAVAAQQASPALHVPSWWTSVP